MRMKLRGLMLGILGVSVLGLVACGPSMVVAQRQRVTFALVFDTRAFNGVTVIADVVEHPGGTPHETLAAGLESYPNTANHAWAKLTTLEEVETNHRYFLEFFLDRDGDGARSSGDLEGVQHFDVMPDAVWSETKFFSADLTEIP
jgi:hypothetical protein